MRAPSRSATSTAAGFTPPTSRSQQMPPNTEMPGTICPTDHASDAVGKSCDFSTTARWPAAAASRAASNASTERSRCGSGPKWQCRSAAPSRSTLMVALLVEPDERRAFPGRVPSEMRHATGVTRHEDLVSLREITDANRSEIEALSVTAQQENFVAGVADSLIEAATTPDAKPWYRASMPARLPSGSS